MWVYVFVHDVQERMAYEKLFLRLSTANFTPKKHDMIGKVQENSIFLERCEQNVKKICDVYELLVCVTRGRLVGLGLDKNTSINSSPVIQLLHTTVRCDTHVEGNNNTFECKCMKDICLCHHHGPDCNAVYIDRTKAELIIRSSFDVESLTDECNVLNEWNNLWLFVPEWRMMNAVSTHGKMSGETGKQKLQPHKDQLFFYHQNPWLVQLNLIFPSSLDKLKLCPLSSAHEWRLCVCINNQQAKFDKLKNILYITNVPQLSMLSHSIIAGPNEAYSFCQSRLVMSNSSAIQTTQPKNYNVPTRTIQHMWYFGIHPISVESVNNNGALFMIHRPEIAGTTVIRIKDNGPVRINPSIGKG